MSRKSEVFQSEASTPEANTPNAGSHRLTPLASPTSPENMPQRAPSTTTKEYFSNKGILSQKAPPRVMSSLKQIQANNVNGSFTANAPVLNTSSSFLALPASFSDATPIAAQTLARIRAQSLISEATDKDFTLQIPTVATPASPAKAGEWLESPRSFTTGSKKVVSTSGRAASFRESIRKSFTPRPLDNSSELSRKSVPKSDDHSSSGQRIFGTMRKSPSARSEAEVASNKSNDWYDEVVTDSDEDSEGGDSNGEGTDSLYALFTGRKLTWRKRLRDILDGNPHHSDSKKSFVINSIVMLAIILSIIVFCIQSFPTFHTGISVPLLTIEGACVAVFMIEAFLRFISSTSWKTLIDFFFIIDIISIVGFFLDLILEYTTDDVGIGLSAIRVVRLVRVFRVLKVSRHSKSLQIVLVVIRTSLWSIMIMLVPVLLIMLITACILYYVELYSAYNWNSTKRVWENSDGNRPYIQSIPDALWYACATVTTVGYGDMVMTTIAARAIGSFLQLMGVLMLSFPNIILGGNLQFAYKEYNRHRAVRKLGKKFRKVYMCVCFIAAIRDKVRDRRLKIEYSDVNEWSPLDDEYAIHPLHKDQHSPPNKGKHGKKSHVNYLVPQIECENFKKADVESIQPHTIRLWTYKGITAASILQRLLEHCSGVGTTEELHQTFVDNGSEATIKDLDVACFYLLEAGYLQLYAFRRFGINMVCALTATAVTELQVHAEEGLVDCIRSAECARQVWRDTAGASVGYSLSILSQTYPSWAIAEQVADDDSSTPNTNFRDLHDADGNPKVKGGSSYALERAGSMRRPGSARARDSKSKQAVSEQERLMLHEAKLVLRDVIARREEHIASLRQKLLIEEQCVADTYGL